MATVTALRAMQVLDSRGQPTVEVEVRVDQGASGRAIAASGASTGQFEACELRDTSDPRYRGKGVYTAVANVNEIIYSRICGLDFRSPAEFDALLCDLDGTENKTRLGANAIVATSMAFVRALARNRGIPLFRLLACEGAEFILPVPMLNVLNGGKHADGGLDLQEMMIVPAGFGSFSEALQAAVEIYWMLKKRIKKDQRPTTVGDEGGFAPGYPDVRTSINVLLDAISDAGYRPGDQVGIAFDAAATEFHADGLYHMRSEGEPTDADGLINYWTDLVTLCPEIVSLEDGLAEEDWANWAKLTAAIGDQVQIVGDDIFVTNPQRLQRGLDERSANSVLIKPNQIGTVTETIRAIDLAAEHGWGRVISHRSGEAEDPFIAHLAVGRGAGQIKTGAPSHERNVKYNELLRIEQQLGSQARFAGWSAFSHIPRLANRS